MFEGCSPECAGRLLEVPGDGVPRWMVVAPRKRGPQNPAYRPTRSPPSDPAFPRYGAAYAPTMTLMWMTSRDLDFAAIRTEFDLPPAGEDGFAADVRTEAAAATDRNGDQREDRTDLPLVTIDPPGSMDLDQAVRVEARESGGWLVYYAIADVGALVAPGGAVESESLRRGQTIYLPDGSVPLHPRELSENSGSLLPGEDRAAVLWRVELSEDAAVVSTQVRRALVRSRERFTYAEVQAAADAGELAEPIAELPAVGRALRAAGVAAGAINLRLPAQDIAGSEGHWELRIEQRTEADEWNAQISLLIGRCAAAIMLDGQCGVLRTLPQADSETLDDLRRTAAALQLDWPEEQSIGEFLDSVDVNTSQGLAMMRASTAALRGADYVAFDGTVPEENTHAGIGGADAHVTASLRRLVDRFATEICLSISAASTVPDWVRAAMDALPETMNSTSRTASSVDRACVDLAEAVALEEYVGSPVAVYVLRSSAEPDKPGGKGRAGEVFLANPPVFAPCTGPVTEGTTATVTVAVADREERRVQFAAAAQNAPLEAENPAS